jgi:5'-nucleotidase
MRPLILMSNDDGFAAPGLRSLREHLIADADVIVCAPLVNQSASSHSLSLHRILRLKEHEPGIFSVDGTPADSVYVALHSAGRVLPRKPDLVVSGLNHGPNLGVDVFYSGTVAAAREAAMRGHAAIALSADVRADPAAASRLACEIVMTMLDQIHRLPPLVAPLLNVNIPPGDRWSVRGTRLGVRLYEDDIVFRLDPRGHEYLWIGGAGARHESAPGSDTDAFDAGQASITPLSLQLTHTELQGVADAIAGAIHPPPPIGSGAPHGADPGGPTS